MPSNPGQELASLVTSLAKILPSLPRLPSGDVCPPLKRTRLGLGNQPANQELQDPEEARESGGSEGRRPPAGDSMKFSAAHFLLPLLPALVFSTR